MAGPKARAGDQMLSSFVEDEEEEEEEEDE